MPLKFVTVNDNVFQLLGTLSPRPPTGALSLDPAGGLPSPRPPRLCSSKISLKNPLGFSVQPSTPALAPGMPYPVSICYIFHKFRAQPRLTG